MLIISKLSRMHFDPSDKTEVVDGETIDKFIPSNQFVTGHVYERRETELDEFGSRTPEYQNYMISIDILVRNHVIQIFWSCFIICSVFPVARMDPEL